MIHVPAFDPTKIMVKSVKALLHVSLRPIYIYFANGEVYSINHYVIKFVSNLPQVGGLLWFPLPIKLTTTI